MASVLIFSSVVASLKAAESLTKKTRNGNDQIFIYTTKT